MNNTLVSGWDTLWQTLTSAVPQMQSILIMVGTIIAVWAIVTFVIEARKNGKGNNKSLIAGIVVGAVIAMPHPVISLILNLAEFLWNFFVQLFTVVTGG